MKFNSKGQEFEPFKLLIGAIIALVVLFIILGIISYLQDINIQMSRQRLTEKLSSAVKSPDNSVIKIQEITLRQGDSFNSQALGASANIKEECLSFQSGLPSIRANDRVVIFNETIKTNAFIKCGSEVEIFACPSECEFCCVISFGRAP